jgi:hypothetical protein
MVISFIRLKAKGKRIKVKNIDWRKYEEREEGNGYL